MADRLIAVDDETFNLPASVNVVEENLPDRLGLDGMSAAYASAFPATQTITYNPDGSVATVTENGDTTSYTYNADGTVATDTRRGVTRKYGYDNGNLTTITKVA